MKTKHINWGIASRVGDTVYVNKRLRRHPKLKSALISHENAHTDGYSKKDILIDFDIKELKGMKWEYYKFILTNPTTWMEFLPIKKYEDEWLFNVSVFLIWLLLGGMIWLAVILI